jgi:hypothetical protein
MGGKLPWHRASHLCSAICGRRRAFRPSWCFRKTGAAIDSGASACTVIIDKAQIGAVLRILLEGATRSDRLSAEARTSYVHMGRIRSIILLLLMAFEVGAAPPSPQSLEERRKSEDEAVAIWPEAADPQSILGREVQRLFDFYSSRGDPRVRLSNAPMWLASEAAANTEKTRTVADSQQSAMRLYPDLGVLDSPLNKLFREKYARLKEVAPQTFEDPRWPIKLAQQSALQLDAQKAVASMPTGNPATPRPGEAAGAVEQAEKSDVAAEPAWAKVVVPLLYAALSVLGAFLFVSALRHALRVKHEHPRRQDDWSI